METKNLIDVVAVQKVNEALAYAKSVQVVTIQNNTQAEHANTLFRELGGHINKLEAERKRVKEPHLQAGRDVDAYFKDPIASLTNLKTKIGQAQLAYTRLLENQRRKEQERLNREAAERQRVLDEQARAQREKAAELERQAREAANAEEAAKLQRASELAAQRAAVNKEKSATVVAPVAQVFTPNLAGSSVRSNWTAQVTDPVAFAKWAVTSGNMNLLMPNQSAINAFAKSVRQEMSYPGLRIFNDAKMVGRAA